MKCKYCNKDFKEHPYKPYSEGFCCWDCNYAFTQIDFLKKCGYELPDGYIEPANIPLTENQERFCEEYIIHRSPYKAFKAVFNTAGMSKSEIMKKGRFLTKLPFIKRRISELIKEFQEAQQPNALNVLEKFAIIGNADMRDFLEPDGRIVSPEEWTYEMGIACKKYTRKYDKNGVLREEGIELYDKEKALMALAKIEKMYNETVDVKVEHSITHAIKTFGDSDLVAKLISSEIDDAKKLIGEAKDVIDVEAEDE